MNCLQEIIKTELFFDDGFSSGLISARFNSHHLFKTSIMDNVV